jgi:hypothetical protein
MPKTPDTGPGMALLISASPGFTHLVEVTEETQDR